MLDTIVEKWYSATQMKLVLFHFQRAPTVKTVLMLLSDVDGSVRSDISSLESKPLFLLLIRVVLGKIAYQITFVAWSTLHVKFAWFPIRTCCVSGCSTKLTATTALMIVTRRGSSVQKAIYLTRKSHTDLTEIWIRSDTFKGSNCKFDDERKWESALDSCTCHLSIYEEPKSQ